MRDTEKEVEYHNMFKFKKVGTKVRRWDLMYLRRKEGFGARHIYSRLPLCLSSGLFCASSAEFVTEFALGAARKGGHMGTPTKYTRT